MNVLYLKNWFLRVGGWKLEIINLFSELSTFLEWWLDQLLYWTIGEYLTASTVQESGIARLCKSQTFLVGSVRLSAVEFLRALSRHIH